MSEKRSESDSTASPLGDSQAPGPLRRWIQRRQRVKAEDEQRILDPADDAVDREAEPFARPASTKTSGENAPAGLQTRKPAAEGIEEEIESGIEPEPEGRAEGKTEGEPEEKILTDADMPPIESLDEHSDYSGFLSPGVSEELRRRALRKLFFSAAFNVRDGLDDYDDDFTSFEALGDMVTADMKHQKEVEAERAQAAQAKAENAAETAPEDAPENTQDIESAHESAQPAEPTAKSETTSPDENQDEHDRAPDRFTPRDSKAQEAFKDAPVEPVEPAEPASPPPDNAPGSAPKSAGTTPEKGQDEREAAQNQPAAKKTAQESLKKEPFDPRGTATTEPRTRTTEASRPPSPPHRSPTSRAK